MRSAGFMTREQVWRFLTLKLTFVWPSSSFTDGCSISIILWEQNSNKSTCPIIRVWIGNGRRESNQKCQHVSYRHGTPKDLIWSDEGMTSRRRPLSKSWTFRFVGEISWNFPNRIVYSAVPFAWNGCLYEAHTKSTTYVAIICNNKNKIN